MREHALPQDVVGYRFHIIGNMTLKQFAEVAIGVVFAFIVYSIQGIPNFIKYPIVVMSAGLGALAAFVPFEERPLDHWIGTIFQALYRPTQFYWKRTSKIPAAFLYEAKVEVTSVKEVDLTPQRHARVSEYLRSVEQPQMDVYDQRNQQHLESVMSAFQEVQTQPVQQPEQITFDAPVENIPAVETIPQQLEMPTYIPAEPLATEVVQAAAPVTEAAPTVVTVPEVGSISMPQTVTAVEETPTAQQQDLGTFAINTAPEQQDITALPTATQNHDLPFPQKPTEPNKLVGMVVDPQNTPLADVIVEIVTPDGMSARAVKTNLWGQFFITTPLANGTYSIVTEKTGYQFSPQQLQLNGQVVDPIEIQSL